MVRKTETIDYRQLRAALDEVLADLQRPDVGVDEAVQLYERGLTLAAQLREYLDQAENKLERLRLQAAGESPS